MKLYVFIAASTVLLTACNHGIEDGVGLRALGPSLGVLGQEVVKVDDAALTAAYRDHAAIWQAAVGD